MFMKNTLKVFQVLREKNHPPDFTPWKTALEGRSEARPMRTPGGFVQRG